MKCIPDELWREAVVQQGHLSPWHFSEKSTRSNSPSRRIAYITWVIYCTSTSSPSGATGIAFKLDTEVDTPSSGLLALNDYYQRTSLAHVVVVCSLGLLPAFVVAVLVECIPFRPPTESWRANYTFWIRLFVSSLPIAFGGVYQVKEVIQPGVISTTGIIATAFGSCACYVALTILVAALWKFPIPFGYVLTIGPFVFFYMVFFLLSIGPRVLVNSPALRRQIFSQMLVIAAQGLLAIAYPTFGAIFKQLSGHEQTAFVFVLPIIKFSIKQFIATVSSHLHEYVGPTVVLSVDVCNVLYISICVQTAISPLTSALLIGSDAFFVVLALRSIYNQSDVARARRRLLSSSSNVPLKINYLLDLMGLLRDAFQCSLPAPVPIRIRAPFPLVLSTESATFMNALVRSSQQVGGEVDYSRNLHTESSASTAGAARIGTCHQEVQAVPDWIVLNEALNSVLAVGPSHPDVHRVTPTELRRDSKLNQLLRVSYDKASRSSIHRISSTASRGEFSYQEDAVDEVQAELQSLFHSEYVVMAEFIECVIPVLYAVYLGCLYHLPTAAYYPHTRSLTPEKFVSTEINLMLYGLVELAAFVAMNLLLQRKFGFSPLYQLAFVFETQVRTLQSHLFVWILCILQITLVHNGVDLDAPFK
ncbi:hypothetical protein PR003_g23814 [Phytophthora rubi]|nr:hypothetical protein PR001_g22379 [Phytophthora rubi]KAE9296218.1 hypothetical protein PR003_g23814 [Phytophthora rubi]